MDTFTFKRLPNGFNVLRWILFLPAGFVAAIFAKMIIVAYSELIAITIERSATLSQWLPAVFGLLKFREWMVQNLDAFVTTLVGVTVSALVAPTHRGLISKVLAGLLLFPFVFKLLIYLVVFILIDPPLSPDLVFLKLNSEKLLNPLTVLCWVISAVIGLRFVRQVGDGNPAFKNLAPGILGRFYTALAIPIGLVSAALALGLLVGIVAIPVLWWTYGFNYVSGILSPAIAASLAISLFFFVFGVLGLGSSYTSEIGGLNLLVASRILITAVWLLCFATAYSAFGFVGLLIGLLLFGVGVIPVGLIALLFQDDAPTAVNAIATLAGAYIFGAVGSVLSREEDGQTDDVRHQDADSEASKASCRSYSSDLDDPDDKYGYIEIDEDDK